MKKAIFLSYDGILEPLGYSQILSYLKYISKNYKIIIISVEKKNDLKNIKHLKKIENFLFENNIIWFHIDYSSSKLGKFILLIELFIKTLYILKKENVKIIHARSYISGTVTYFLKIFKNFFFIFDIRGFWIEERVEWNLWKKKSLKYKFFKFFEDKIFKKSNSIVTLTQDAKNIILKKNIKNIKISVIPTCVNLDKKKIIKKNSNFITFTHLGAIGTRYNFDAYLNIVDKIQQTKKNFVCVINKGEHSYIRQKIKNYNLTKENYSIKYIPPYEIDNAITASNFGVFFPVSGFYLNGYFPTKLGEFLSNGIPIITCRINNHVDNIIKENNIGIIIENIDFIDYEVLNKKIYMILNDAEISQRCKSVANKYFNIKFAIEKYLDIYKLSN